MKLEQNNYEKQIILDSLDKEGKLPCAKALALAKKLKIDSYCMVDVANELNIKIVACELGVFGKKEISDMDEELHQKILSYSSENKKVRCDELWQEAKNSNMKKVRSVVKQGDIYVTYCQLGCFKEGRKHGSKS